MKIAFLVASFFLFLPAWGQGPQFVFVFLHSKPDKAALPKAEVDKIMEGHMANIKRLAGEGKLISAGPFEGGGGIFIFKAASVDQAKEWLSSDPGVKANRWDVELLPFTPRIGSACAVSEPYQMVNYEFVRYTIKITKYNVRDAAETARQHDEYLKKIARTGNVIAEGTFGDDGGILVVLGELQKEVIEADPSVTEGFYEVDYKKLYIAKGSFCEK
jgi:uncharacterized protein YciI